jgi:hypothetical protein
MALLLVSKRPGRQADNSRPSNADIHSSMSLHGIVLKLLTIGQVLYFFVMKTEAMFFRNVWLSALSPNYMAYDAGDPRPVFVSSNCWHNHQHRPLLQRCRLLQHRVA